MPTQNIDQENLVDVSQVATVITEKFDEVRAANDEQKKLVNELYDRMQTLEQSSYPHPDTAAHAPVGYRKYHGENGAVYEVEKGASVAKVLGGKAPEISFDRWLGASVAGERCEDKAALDYIRETKSIVTTTTGANVPQEFVGEWIDRLRAASVLQQAGAITVPMDTKTVNYARQTGDPTASWHTEAGATSTSDPTFEAAALTAKTIYCRTQVSLEMMQDVPTFGSQLSNAMFGAIGAEIDRAGLHGAGGTEPAGIYGASGVSTVAGVSVPTNYTEMLTALKTLLDSNNRLEDINRYALMSPRSWLTYQGLVTGISSDNTPLQRPEAVRDTRFLVTTNVNDALGSPADDSTIFMGNFNNVIMGVRMDPSIKILEIDSYAQNLLYEVVSVARVDFMLARPSGLCTLLAVDD